MYSYIKGELVEVLENSIVIDNHGIGYEIKIPDSISHTFSGIGQEIKIYTYTYVREDAFQLYGFLTRDDLNVFRLLLSVNGIGPKGALAVLSVMTPDELRFAVLAEDDKVIAKAPGIGKKSAQRVIIELKDKLSVEEIITPRSKDISEKSQRNIVKNEAIQALTALGYSATEALKVVNGVEITEETTVEELLKLALKTMSFL